MAVADGVRFELTEGLHPRRFSRPMHSTALPPILRVRTYDKSYCMSSMNITKKSASF